MSDLATYVAALETSFDGVAAVCADLTPEQWALPTELPGWSVKDNVSHIAGEESLLLGDPEPDHELPDLPHLRSESARGIERLVDVRRPLPGEVVLAELRSIAERRLAMLRGWSDEQLDEKVEFAGALRPMRQALGIRVFDVFSHEQDIRRALGRPGGVPSPGAAVSLGRLLRAWSGLAEDVPEAAGRSMVVQTTGALPSVSTLRFGVEPSCSDGAAGNAGVRAVLDVDTFFRLATGRVPYDAVAPSVTLSGDVALGEALLRHAAVTP
jgi:uncharacterized protein (TIGR03083 family)